MTTAPSARRVRDWRSSTPLPKLNEQATRPKLSAPVGIDSGAVVVGASASKDADLFGDAPNMAARVQTATKSIRKMLSPGVGWPRDG